jgi:toxin CptA
MTSAPAIGFEYAPSRGWGRACAGMTLLAAAAGWLSALPWWCALALTAALAVALPPTWRAWRRPPIRSAGWAADGGWTLRDAHWADTPATLLSSRALGDCLWLRLQPTSGAAVNLLLTPDNSDADLRRRLRMRLAAAC